MIGRLVATALCVIAGIGPAFAGADSHGHCLTREERRAAVGAKQVIPLSAALRAAHGRRGELVSARLCRGQNGLQYLLTLLARDGKVTRATVDAGTGKLADSR